MPQSRARSTRPTSKHAASSVDDVLASDDDLASRASAPDAAGEADDLLASMADDAIDRMLAAGRVRKTSAAPEQDMTLSAVERSALPGIVRRAPVATVPLPRSEAELDAMLAGGSSAAGCFAIDDDAAQALSDELELDALQSAPAAVPQSESGAQAVDLDADTPAAPSRQARWLLPLIWLNAPLNSAAPTVRDAVGKVALLTLLNAAGLFIYGVLRG